MSNVLYRCANLAKHADTFNRAKIKTKQMENHNLLIEHRLMPARQQMVLHQVEKGWTVAAEGAREVARRHATGLAMEIGRVSKQLQGLRNSVCPNNQKPRLLHAQRTLDQALCMYTCTST